MGNIFRLFVVVALIVMFVGCGGNRAGDLSQTPAPGQPTAGPIFTDPSLGLQNQIEVLPVLGNEGVLQDDPLQQNTPGGNLPEFPGGGGETFSPVHMVSEEGYQTPGNAFVDSFGANNRAGATAGEYVLIPEEGGIAWARYSIADLTGDRPVRIDVAVSPAELEAGSGEGLLLSYWIGVADYTLFHWDWHGPFTGPQDVVINSEELLDRYVSETGTLHWVTVLYGDEKDGLPGITLQTGTVVTDADYIANKPHYTAIDTIEVGSGGSGGGKGASSLDPSQFITIDWSHVEAFNIMDEQNEAISYRIYRRGPEDGSPKYVSDMFPSMTVFTDPTDNGQGIDDPIPGATYRYYVRAINLAGFTPLSQPIGVQVPLLPPTNLVASIAGYPDQITLDWDKAEGATEYLVYRDQQDVPLASVGDVDTWDDGTLAPGDYSEHTYWLRSANQYLPEGGEQFSEPAIGRKDAVPVALLEATPGAGLAPLPVAFDASNSHDPDNGTGPGDGISLYEWDFNGDGVFSNEIGSLTEEDSAAGTHPGGSTAQFTYTDDGSYNPAVRVTDDNGTSGNMGVAVTVGNTPPVADLGADPAAGNWPLEVALDAGGSSDVDGSIVSYQFNYGEGSGWETPIASPTEQHTYNSAGDYTAKVQVQDDDGAWAIVPATKAINVNYLPTAELTADPTSGALPLVVDFSAAGSTDPDGTIIDHEWDFDGNGTFNEVGSEADERGNPIPQYTYIAEGTFNAAVRVTDDAGGMDTATVEIDVIGWTHTWGGSSADEIRGITLDSSGNTFVLGRTNNFGQGSSDVLLLKYTPAGILEFATTYGLTGSDWGYDIVSDGGGNLYVTGVVDTLSPIYNDEVWLLRFNSEGTVTRNRSWGGIDSDDESGHSLALDNSGNVVIAGRTRSFGVGSIDTLLLLFDSSLTPQWARAWGGNGPDYANSINIDSTNSIYVAGTTRSYGAGEADALLLKYDATGNLQWARTWGGAYDEFAYSVVSDGTSIFVTGYTELEYNSNHHDVFLLKYDSDGALQWARRWGGTSKDEGNTVVINNGNVWVLGICNSYGSGSEDVVLLQYDSSGNLQSQKTWGISSRDLGYAMTFDAQGIMYVGGIAFNVSGSWQDVTGSEGSASGTSSAQTGTETSPPAGGPQSSGGTATFPVTGTEDTGGGNDDALVMKFDPDLL